MIKTIHELKWEMTWCQTSQMGHQTEIWSCESAINYEFNFSINRLIHLQNSEGYSIWDPEGGGGMGKNMWGCGRWKIKMWRGVPSGLHRIIAFDFSLYSISIILGNRMECYLKTIVENWSDLILTMHELSKCMTKWLTCFTELFIFHDFNNSNFC